ncbi:MAG: MBL fold metallo-hydrolase [Firmicutes bacterium]|nr:MBL fold metallo-hydrolase [Bacillota bacterium]
MSLKFCSLASGSSGNCQYIETEKVKILIDAGLSGKKIQNGLDKIGVDPKSIDCILVTHEHKDHTKGVGILSRRFNLPIYANNNTWNGMLKDLGKLKDENIREFKSDIDFEISDIGIHPFKTFHDSNESVGFNFHYRNKKISILTDTGCVNDNIKNKIKNSDLLMIEANHDIDMLKVGKYPWFLKKRVLSDNGHLSNEAAGELITEVFSGRNETFVLGHLSKENNFPELAHQTVVNIITEKGINIEKELKIDLALRDSPTKVYNII